MPRFLVRKLIRDTFSQHAEWEGTRVLSDDDFLYELKRKLVEEAEEILEASDRQDFLEEIADVQEVLAALIKASGFTPEEIATVRDKKYQERGGFERRVFAESLNLPEGHVLMSHCRAQPHKYKEL